MNFVCISGNLGRDPEVRVTTNGTSVANLNVAVNDRAKLDNGQWGNKTCWVRVICFGRTAENCQRYLTKGRRVEVAGRLTKREWEDKTTGQKRSIMEVIADRVEFVSDGQSRQSDGPAPSGYGTPAPAPAPKPTPAATLADDEPPF